MHVLKLRSQKMVDENTIFSQKCFTNKYFGNQHIFRPLYQIEIEKKRYQLIMDIKMQMTFQSALQKRKCKILYLNRQKY